jgi:hypothetical protein
MISIVNKHWHKPTKNDCYCGRGSPFGNPYSHMKGTKAEFVVETREEAVEKFLPHFENIRVNDVKAYKALKEMLEHVLDGNNLNLVCYCAPSLCHCIHIKNYLDRAVYEIQSGQPG